ncbi:universal stress protein [Streptomyces cavernicola]|uniref:Universal stress protein n=1 Tax=Streptomyces cavernicola TaxID=3043613 RepID=A0ABT6SBS3_9ACTN|nr:universal stress protein [Streptomyces sp. B-S-A6]MDI3405374.1 universal stress protein [Streptomyces sp. B-S-A6]
MSTSASTPSAPRANGGPILAAVDGSEPSLKALTWAVDAALGHGREVVAAHVRTGRDSSAPDLVRARIEETVAAYGERTPPVRYVAVDGAPASALCELADEAALLVLGSRGLGGFAALLLGSNGRKCAAQAPCPVVVVPHESRAAHAAQGGPPGRVVLGLDPEETADEVIDFAFAGAARRGVELQVVSTYRVPLRALTTMGDLVPGDAADARRAGLALTAGQRERLTAFAERYPKVAVDPVVAPADPAGRLVTASRTADLLVVGRHRRRLTTDTLIMGSVANAVLLHAHCAVAVVPGR